MKQVDLTSKVSITKESFKTRCLIFRAPFTKCVSEEIYGGIAQLGEHLLCKQGVSGSIPLISTKSEKPSITRLNSSTRLKGKTTKPERNGLIAQPVRAHA